MRDAVRRHCGAASPCAACKLLRRRCASDCGFAPYFPADEPHKFANVHKVFGASNVSKMLQELPMHHRRDAVSSMVYEANARVRDPVYGCVGAISSLQERVNTLQTQLALAQAEVIRMRMRQAATIAATTTMPVSVATASGNSSGSGSSGAASPLSEPMAVPEQVSLLAALDLVADQSNMGGEAFLWSY